MVRFLQAVFGQRDRGGITLRDALLRLILITLLPLAIASAVIAWQLWRSQLVAAEDNLHDTSTVLSLAVDREIAGIRGQLQAVAGSRMVDEERWLELHDFLRSLAAERYGAVVGIVDTTGQLKVQSNFEFGAPLPNLWMMEGKHEEADWQGLRLPISSQGLTRRVVETGAPAVSSLYISMVARRPVIGVAVPVIRGERVRYAVVYSFPTESLERFFAGSEASPLRIVLIDQKGRVVAKSASAAEGVGMLADPDLRVQGAPEKKWWIAQRVAADGVRVLSAFSTSETTGWTIRASQPVTEALAPAYRAAWTWLALFGLVLALAVLAARVLSGRLAAPLVELADSAGRAPHAPSSTGIREIDVLGERLARSGEAEEARRAELERRIAAEERERAAAESERIVRRHMEELEDADRRKDQFLAMLGHELRNPLAPILNSARLIRHQRDADSATRSAAVIERQVHHLARLIDDLLDVARITEGKIVLQRARVPLLPLLYQAIESTRGMIEARAQHLSIHAPSAPVFLDADPARIVQVLTNLLNNAAKYTPNGGTIDVAAERQGGEVLIRVRDDGIGIAPDLLPRLFVAFAQGPEARERSQGGLGIGLALVKRLVEMHGGSVTAASEGTGRGSEFNVRLPVADAIDSAAAPRAEAAPSNSGALACLVVDDNIDAADTLVALLGSAGHRASACYDAGAALQAWDREQPQLAILDIGLPGMDGYELARRIRAREDGGRVFLAALTGYGQASDAARAIEAGFDVHLVKPLAPDALDALTARAAAFLRERPAG